MAGHFVVNGESVSVKGFQFSTAQGRHHSTYGTTGMCYLHCFACLVQVNVEWINQSFGRVRQKRCLTPWGKWRPGLCFEQFVTVGLSQMLKLGICVPLGLWLIGAHSFVFIPTPRVIPFCQKALSAKRKIHLQGGERVNEQEWSLNEERDFVWLFCLVGEKSWVNLLPWGF